MSTALIYNPYLDTLGGGERYSLSVAQLLLDAGWEVVLAWPDEETLKKARQRFNLPLEKLELSREHFLLFQGSDLLSRRRALSGLDLVFFVSDGAVPLLFGRNRFLHYQVPFTKINRLKLINQAKLLTIDQVIVNSHFTKAVIDRTLGTHRSVVVYPPVSVDAFSPGKKTKTILNVGRFSSPSHSKRQDVLIDAFKKLCDQGLSGWQLVLAGGTSDRHSVLDELQKQAHGYPIKFEQSPKFSVLQQLYASATLYWHAAGFEVDQTLNPEATEHFGITTVEAMAAGCVPLVVNAGGLKEIVSSQEGYLWDTTDQLIQATNELLKKPQTLKKLSQASMAKAEHFSFQKFAESFSTLIK